MTSFLVTYKENKYEIQKFLKSHPAGEEILLPYKDKDITEAFDEIGHSKSALKILSKYLVEQQLLENPLLEKVEQKPLGKQKEEVVQYNINKMFRAFAMISFVCLIFYSKNMQLFAEQCSNNFTTFRKSWAK